MTGSANNQSVYATASDIDAYGDIELGFRRLAGVRTVYARLTDRDGNVHTMEETLPDDDIEHKAELVFPGSDGIVGLFLDDVQIDVLVVAAGWMNRARIASLNMQPVNTGTNMSIGEFEITNCDLPAVAAG